MAHAHFTDVAVTPLLETALTGWLVLLVSMTVVWIVSVKLRDASIADIGWGLLFVVLAWLYHGLFGATAWRPAVLTILVTVWGLRLSTHVYWRHRGQPEDPRYRTIRDARGPAFWWQSLFLVFWLQATLAWLIAMPLLAGVRSAAPEHVTPTDVLGVAAFVMGLTMEVVADQQLVRFKAAESNRGKVLQAGLWRYSRHPNYFGEAMLWWGVYLVACSTSDGWLTLASPVLLTWLLLKVSGVGLLEPHLEVAKPGYSEYTKRTSAFVPWFPRAGRVEVQSSAPSE